MSRFVSAAAAAARPPRAPAAGWEAAQHGASLASCGAQDENLIGSGKDERPRAVSCFAWNKDGTRLALSPNNHEVWIYETKSKDPKDWTRLYVLDEVRIGRAFGVRRSRFAPPADPPAALWLRVGHRLVPPAQSARHVRAR
jgi:hypothetical protein